MSLASGHKPKAPGQPKKLVIKPLKCKAESRGVGWSRRAVCMHRPGGCSRGGTAAPPCGAWVARSRGCNRAGRSDRASVSSLLC
eukprot:365344-Chlamydomonas_euryale.AAC.6